MQMQSNLRAEIGINHVLLMYVGNLETYQGVDLLLESFALTLKKNKLADLVIIGGEASDIQKYKQQAKRLGILENVHFLGPKPVDDLGLYLAQADIVVSPRVKGKNTPMKLYSYLHSGKALLATDLPTHTQVLNSQISRLAAPKPQAFSQGMVNLIDDPDLRLKLGSSGKEFIEQNHTYKVFCRKFNLLYDWLYAGLVEGATGALSVEA